MARKSLDTAVKTHRDTTEKNNNERFDKLHTEVVGIFAEILDDVFPHKDDDQPDWKKFEWARATQLKTALQQFKDGFTIVSVHSRETGDDQPTDTPNTTARQQDRVTRETRDTGDGEAVTVIRPARPASATRTAPAARTTVTPPASTPRKSVRQRMTERLNS